MRRILMYNCNTWILDVCELLLLTSSGTPDYDVQDCYNSEHLDGLFRECGCRFAALGIEGMSLLGC